MADGTRARRNAGSNPATSGDERWVELDRRLDASPDRVYRAFADPEEVPRWLSSGVEGGLAVGTRSTLVWPDRRVWWEIVEATPNRRLVIRHPAALDEALVTTASIAIAAQGYGTRLTVRDGPFAVRDGDGIDAWAAAVESWTEAVTMLRAYLDFSVDLRPRR